MSDNKPLAPTIEADMQPYKKLTYKKDKYSKKIIQPEIYLCARNLKKIGRLYPVESPQIVTNYNAADELSFVFYKYTNDVKCNFYDELNDLSIIKVENSSTENMYFELSVTEIDNGSLYKKVSGKSLGHCELGQKLVTLDANTENDIKRTDYKEPTILYNKENVKASLLHRILTYAPDYEIGHVDDTIACLQRIFSWSNTTMDNCFNDICKELDCIYTIDVFLDDDNKARRVINFYDICYCKDCWDKVLHGDNSYEKTGDFWKNVVNATSQTSCQTCGGTNIYEVGENTSISVNTKNLTDEITVEADKDSIKNCFKLKAGDDYLTNIVQGVNISGSNKIMMFSEEQLSKMSDELREKWESYFKDVQDKTFISQFEKITNTEYNILDLILYLESGKMPTPDTSQETLDDQCQKITEGIKGYAYRFYTNSSASISKAKSASQAVENLVSTFMKNGYSYLVTTKSTSENKENGTCYYWYGTIKVYKTDDRKTYFTLTIDTDGLHKEMHEGENGEVITSSVSGIIYRIVYGDKDIENYKLYIRQQIHALLKSHDVSDYDAWDWKLYCVNRLNSFYDGYQECITVLEQMKYDMEEEETEGLASKTDRDSIIDTLKNNYTKYLYNINTIRNVIEDQLFALYFILGDIEKLKKKYPAVNKTTSYEYEFKNKYTLNQKKTTLLSVLNSMADGMTSTGDTIASVSLYKIDSEGNASNEKETCLIGFIDNCNRGLQCRNCGSTNVVYNSSTQKYQCKNKFCKSSDVITYVDYVHDVIAFYKAHPDTSVISQLDTMNKTWDIKNYMDDNCYKELCSFLREDVYENSNYSSENIDNNTKLISTARAFIDKAKEQLAIACTPQIHISCNIASLVVQDDVKAQNISIDDAYEKFALGNYIRVISNDIPYKLRILSISYPFDTIDNISVTFSNVTKSLFGSSSDVESILSQASSMATTFNSVAKQAEKGENASFQFDTIKKEGLDTSLSAIKAASNQDIVIDDKGILCRYYNNFRNAYDDKQLKIINRNIVMTDDNWETSKLAIGLGLHNNKPAWGVWADMLVGDLIAGKELVIRNDNSSVVIDEEGITLDTGKIKWVGTIDKKDINGLSDFETAIKGSLGITDTEITSDSIISPKIGGGYAYFTKGSYSVEIDPNHQSEHTTDGYLFCIRNSDKVLMGVNTNGDGCFSGSFSCPGQDNSTIKIEPYGGILIENQKPDDYKYNFTCSGANLEMRDNYGISDDDWENGTSYRSRFQLNVSEKFGGYMYLLGKQINFDLSDGLYINNGKITHSNDSNNDFSFSGNLRTNGCLLIDNGPVERTYVAGVNIYDNLQEIQIGDFYNLSLKSAGLICANGSAIATTSDERQKKEFTDLSEYEPFFFQIEPCAFKFTDGKSDRYHTGFKSQQIRQALENTNKTSQDFGGYVYESGTDSYYLRYEEFIALNTHMIQKLYQRVEALEALLKEKGIDTNE